MLVKKCKVGSIMKGTIVCFKRIPRIENFCMLCGIPGCIMDCKLTNSYIHHTPTTRYIYIPKYVIETT